MNDDGTRTNVLISNLLKRFDLTPRELEKKKDPEENGHWKWN
jgi:hypothetical protein